MRLFAALADHGNFSAAARALDVPKQTFSRRIAELEEDLGVELVRRTTRRVRLTELGTAYAERCRQLASLASEANELVRGADEVPRGCLRVTADPTFGEAFLAELVTDYLERFSEVEVEVVLTSRRVDLIEEGFDLAFRVGRLEDSTLVATRLAGARLVYCASPAYLRAHGRPVTPEALEDHAIIEHTPRAGTSRWPFVDGEGKGMSVAVRGRVRVNSLALARRLALAGFGVANLPEFACAEDLAEGRLESVLGDWVGEVGGVWLLRPAHKLLSVKLRRFVDLATARLRG